MITLYRPKINDLWFREKLLSDEATMSYNHAWGGTIPFPKEKWEDWYDYWLINHENKRFYRYIEENGEFLGETAYHFDEKRNICLADVIVHASRRGKGYGKQALLLLCESAEKDGFKELFDDIASDNPAIKLFISCGFEEAYRTSEYIMLKKQLKP